MALDENQLRTAAHLRRSIQDRADVAALVARGHDYRHQRLSLAGVRAWGGSRHDKVCQRGNLERPHARQIPIGYLLESPGADWQQNLVPAASHFEVCQVQEVVDVLDGQPVLLEQRLAHAEGPCQVQRDLPQAAVEVENQPRAGPRHALQLAEGDLDVPQVVDHVGQDDDVEGLAITQ